MKHISILLYQLTNTYFYLVCISTNVLYATFYHTTFSKKVFVIVDEPNYTRNTSVYCVTMFV